MTLKDILSGKWLKHPVHPMVVSLPVGAWSMALVFDVLSRMGDGNNTFVRTAFYCILLGLAGALLAVPTGVADWSEIKKEKPAWRLGLYHLTLNVAVAILFAVNLGVRWRGYTQTDEVAGVPLALSLVGTALLWVSGYLGGRMVYEHGISVARHSKEKWREIAERAGGNVPAKEAS